MKKRYLLIDGYNLLFKMKEYNKIKNSKFAIERDILIDILKEYVSGNEYTKVYCVFDAYQSGNKEYIKESYPIFLVYTKTGVTADEWIEIKTKELYINHFSDVIVISDDRDERDSALGYGAIIRDCHRFIKDIYERKNNLSKQIKKHNNTKIRNNNIRMTDDVKIKLEKFLLNGEKF